MTDWKERFIASYDVELQAFIDGVRQGALTGPSAGASFLDPSGLDPFVLDAFVLDRERKGPHTTRHF